MPVLEPDDDRDKIQNFDWSLPSDLPLTSHLAHRVVCDEIDKCYNVKYLQAAAKSYHALYKKTQHTITQIAKQDFGFPTNMDGV